MPLAWRVFIPTFGVHDRTRGTTIPSSWCMIAPEFCQGTAGPPSEKKIEVCSKECHPKAINSHPTLATLSTLSTQPPTMSHNIVAVARASGASVFAGAVQTAPVPSWARASPPPATVTVLAPDTIETIRVRPRPGDVPFSEGVTGDRRSPAPVTPSQKSFAEGPATAAAPVVAAPAAPQAVVVAVAKASAPSAPVRAVPSWARAPVAPASDPVVSFDQVERIDSVETVRVIGRSAPRLVC